MLRMGNSQRADRERFEQAVDHSHQIGRSCEPRCPRCIYCHRRAGLLHAARLKSGGCQLRLLLGLLPCRLWVSLATRFEQEHVERCILDRSPIFHPDSQDPSSPEHGFAGFSERWSHLPSQLEVPEHFPMAENLKHIEVLRVERPEYPVGAVVVF